MAKRVSSKESFPGAFFISLVLRVVCVSLMFIENNGKPISSYLMLGVVLLVTLPLFWIGFSQSDFAFADAAIIVLFVGSQIMTLSGHALTSTIIGPDKLFHLCAGAALAYTAIVVLRWRGKSKASLSFWIPFLIAVGLGISWELFEWTLNLLSSLHLTMIDTVLDVISDTIGAALVSFFVRR